MAAKLGFEVRELAIHTFFKKKKGPVDSPQSFKG
jgi:hypothetical protein